MVEIENQLCKLFSGLRTHTPAHMCTHVLAHKHTHTDTSVILKVERKAGSEGEWLVQGCVLELRFRLTIGSRSHLFAVTSPPSSLVLPGLSSDFCWRTVAADFECSLRSVNSWCQHLILRLGKRGLVFLKLLTGLILDMYAWLPFLMTELLFEHVCAGLEFVVLRVHVLCHLDCYTLVT